jgi:hypothetical protein
MSLFAWILWLRPFLMKVPTTGLAMSLIFCRLASEVRARLLCINFELFWKVEAFPNWVLIVWPVI